MSAPVYWAEYWIANDALQREGPFPLIAQPGLAVVAYDVLPDRSATVWAPSTHTFVAPLTARPATTVSKIVFLRDRLGLAVLAGALAREATDPTIAAFRMLIDNSGDEIHLDDQATILGIEYLKGIGIITNADATRILAAP